METLPAALPADVGENFAVNEAFWPALIVRGRVNPLIVKPGPEAEAAEMVTLAVPVFVNVTGTEPLLPTRRLPKLTLAGLAESAA